MQLLYTLCDSDKKIPVDKIALTIKYIIVMIVLSPFKRLPRRLKIRAPRNHGQLQHAAIDLHCAQ